MYILACELECYECSKKDCKHRLTLGERKNEFVVCWEKKRKVKDENNRMQQKMSAMPGQGDVPLAGKQTQVKLS